MRSSEKSAIGISVAPEDGDVVEADEVLVPDGAELPELGGRLGAEVAPLMALNCRAG